LSKLKDILGITELTVLIKSGLEVICVKYRSFGPYESGTFNFSFGVPDCV